MVNRIREKDESQTENPHIDSDLIYFKSEAKKYDNLTHFALLLTNDVSNSIQSNYVRNSRKVIWLSLPVIGFYKGAAQCLPSPELSGPKLSADENHHQRNN